MSSSSEQLDDRANISFVDYVDILRIPYEGIELATNNFSDANLLPIQSPSSSSFQKLIYKGQLEQSDGQLIDIVARRLPEVQDNIVFNELLTSYLLTHKHILRVFKISGTDDPIIINKYEANESLDKHLSDSTLTWMQRLHICVGVAHALSYIHDFDADGDFSVIHGNIKSSKILLDENWEPKLNCFGFSMFVKKHQPHLASKYHGAIQYLDPEYEITEGLTHKSDVFSFGVVLFEVLFGKIASIQHEDNWYFAKLARSMYEKKRLGDIINTDLHKQMDLKSLDIFSETAYCCLKKESSKRPNMVQIVENLEASLELQQNHESLIMSLPSNQFAHLQVPLEDILSTTNNFAEENVISTSGFAKEYKGQLLWSGELIDITARRLTNKEWNDREQLFWMEISMLSSLKHKNLVSLVGFCDQNDEKIIINTRAIRGFLSQYLSDPMLLTWVRRLEISVDVAHALSYIHYDESRNFSVIHRNINSSTVLLNDDWEPKLCNFEYSMKIEASQRHHSFHTNRLEYVTGYGDPTYIETKSVNHKSDMYSFGIVLFELLCGRESIIDTQDNKYLGPVAIFHYKKKILYEIIDPVLWKQMDPQSFNIFAETAYDCLNEEQSQRPNIDEIVARLESALKLQMERQNDANSIVAAKVEDTSSNHDKGSLTYQCIHHRREKQPRANEVVIQLKKALEFQEDHEKWEHKLPKDYKEIIQMSKCPEMYSTIKKEDLYNIFSKGILVQQDKGKLMSFDGDRERNEMVPSTMFSYIGSCPHEWKYLPESRFGIVVEMLDISNLNIEIKTRAQFLSPNVVYGMYLIFKFCDSRNFSSKPVYVNLKYRKGRKILHTYFATWRDEQWMMTELHRFSNQKEDVVFEFLLESFSLYYNGDVALCIEGIEFRAIDKVKHEEIGKLKEVQQVLKSDFNVDQVQQLQTNFEEIFKVGRNYDELFWLGEVVGKKLLLLSAKAALYKFSNVDSFTSKPPAQSRFQEVIEFLPQQVFHINCTIKSQMLSPDTKYVCYLMFKISENCQGMNCPVKVRDILLQENKEAEFLYFITPAPLNIHDITRVPKQREDGWMEIQLWKFNSAHEFKDDSLSMNMRFTSLEGTMSGLIICGLEFRPMLLETTMMFKTKEKIREGYKMKPKSRTFNQKKTRRR